MNDTVREVVQIPISLIVPHPDNVRQVYDEDELALLTKDIARRGVAVPVEVFKLPDGKYQLSKGHRRVLAATAAKLESVPALMVKSLTPADFVANALMDAETTASLNQIELGDGYVKLMKLKVITSAELSKLLGISAATISKTLTVRNNLHSELHPHVMSGAIKARTAYRLATVRERARQLELGLKIVNKELEPTELETLLDEEGRERRGKKPIRLPMVVNLADGWDSVIGVFEEVVSKLNRLRKAGAKTDAVRGLFK